MFITTSLSFTSLNFFKSTGTPKSSTSVFKLFKLVGTLTNLLMSSLSTSAFEVTKSFLAAKSDVSTPAACSNSFVVV